MMINSSTPTFDAAISSTPGMSSWIIDSGASFYMTPNASLLSKLSLNSFKSFVSMADGTSLDVEGMGSLEKVFGSKQRISCFKN
jgi:hypothetical protein